MAIIRAAPIKNSKAPVYLSTWIFQSLQHLFCVYKEFYFTTSVELGFSPSALRSLSHGFGVFTRSLSEWAVTKEEQQQQKSPSKSKALSLIFQEALVRVCKCLAGWKMKNRAQIWHKQLSVTGVNDYRKWKWWKLNDKVICFSCKLVSKRLCSRIFIPPGLKLSLKALRTTFGREQSR